MSKTKCIWCGKKIAGAPYRLGSTPLCSQECLCKAKTLLGDFIAVGTAERKKE